MNRNFLDKQLLSNLREVINKTDIFIKDDVEKQKFDLICAFMDRLDSSVGYVNNHLDIPNSEDDFILLMVHFCIIKDGISEVCKCLGVENNDTDYFKDTCVKLFKINQDEYIGDNKFFEYFRSLVFAHPFLTNRPKFLETGEINYSPFVIPKFHFHNENCVGVRVYSNKKDMFDLAIDYDDLKSYIKDKYNIINVITKNFDSIIKNKEENWKKHKVDRSGNSIDILNNIELILTERYIDTDSIDELIEYLKCESTLDKNDKIIEEFKKSITNIIPKLCDCVDNMNYEEMENIISSTIGLHPKKAHNMMHYQLEKIYCYLNDYEYIGKSNKQWGLQQAKDFSKEFAKKYVTFDFDKMSFIEIKMLVTIACIEEYKNEIMEEGVSNE